MLPLSILPDWIPSDALALSLVALVVGVLVMNRQRVWFMNVLDRREPMAVAFGVFLVFAAYEGWFTDVVGFGSVDLWVGVGVIALLAGILSQYTGLIDL